MCTAHLSGHALSASHFITKMRIYHASTVMPMFLAVPSMIFIPASTVVAFKSGIFVSAISCTAGPGCKPCAINGCAADDGTNVAKRA